MSMFCGYDRGKPVDRAYIEQFLEANARDIRGRVLEIRNTRYTDGYGGDRVTSRDVLDIDSTNSNVTIVADLGRAGSLPEERFDCVIVTQTLQYVRRPEIAIENLWRSLSPDGVALITVPCTSRIDSKFRDIDRWRLTPAGLALLLADVEWSEIEVNGFGNVLTSAAFLFGLAADELRERELAEHDDSFPLIATARARKPAQPSA